MKITKIATEGWDRIRLQPGWSDVYTLTQLENCKEFKQAMEVIQNPDAFDWQGAWQGSYVLGTIVKDLEGKYKELMETHKQAKYIYDKVVKIRDQKEASRKGGSA